MRFLDRALLRFVLKRVLGQVCPSTVPRSGRAGKQANCFTTTYSETDDPDMVFLSMRGDEIAGLGFDGWAHDEEKTILLDAIDPARLRITHFYGLDEVQYSGARDAALGFLTGWPCARIRLYRLANRVAQRVFNRRPLQSKKRLDVLREVVAIAPGRPEGVSALDLMTHRYTYRWAGHPDWQAHQEELDFQLQLLSESGELKNLGQGYRPTGIALRTLEESEDQDRKHAANFRVQVLLAFLALLSVAMAVIQAGLVKLPPLIDLTAPVKNDDLQCMNAAPTKLAAADGRMLALAVADRKDPQ